MAFQFYPCEFEKVPPSHSLKDSKQLPGRYSCWGWKQAHYWDHGEQKFFLVKVCGSYACFKINYFVPTYVVARLLRSLPEHPYLVLHTRIDQNLHFALLRLVLVPKVNNFRPTESPSWCVPAAWDHLLEASL